ncbi:Protein PIN-LIKES 7, partial [Zea mays]
MASTDKRRKPRKPAPDHCPRCMQRRRDLFGDDSSTCRPCSLSYSSLSMVLGGLFIWTHTYSLMQKSGKLYHKMQSKSIQCPVDSDEEHEQAKEDGPAGCADEEAPLPTSVKPREHEHGEEEEHQMVSNFTAQSTASSAAMHGHGGILGETDSPELQEAPLLSCESEVADKGFWTKLKDVIHQFIDELMAPPTISAIIGFVVGLFPWLKSIIVGDGAPFKVIQDSLQLMGDGTIPCITLILDGNLTQGLRKSGLKRVVIVAILCVRFGLLPLIGIAIVRAAYGLGFLSRDPLYCYVLMVQFVVPPAMNIGTYAHGTLR